MRKGTTRAYFAGSDEHDNDHENRDRRYRTHGQNLCGGHVMGHKLGTDIDKNARCHGSRHPQNATEISAQAQKRRGHHYSSIKGWLG